jgi:hypothetical protein
MSTISLEHQKQLGRQLGRLRQNAPEAENPGEDAGNSSQMSAVGTASFIMLGGFALLKDIFDFVFVDMAISGANLKTTSWALWALEWFVPVTKIKYLKFLLSGLKWLSPSEWVNAAGDEKIATALVMPILFTTMFMIIVVTVLLLSGMGVKSYKIFLSARFIFGSLVATIAEIVPILNAFPWTVIFVIFLYFHVKKELKKQAGESQAAYPNVPKQIIEN